MTYTKSFLRFASLILTSGAFFTGAPTVFAAAPVIAPHADIVLEATSPLDNSTGFASPLVTYTPPNATDDIDGEVPATCTPASGSSFLFGVNDVECTYHSTANGDALPTHFSVIVQDTTLPLIGPHADKSAIATGFLTQVNYGAPNAFDPTGFRLEGARPATCIPSDGSLFPVGTTPIVCNASDSSGNNAAPTTFNVIVTLPAEIPEGFCGDGAHFDTELQTCVEDLPPPPVIVDVCANIEGIQSEIPEGTTREGEDCVTTPVETTAGRSGGGGGGNSGVRGEVLGASTDTESSGGSCHLFSADLTLGSTGAEVTALQNFLIGKGYTITAGATGYFGTQTKAALASYQTASGILPSSGYFGPLTRMKVNASCPLAETEAEVLARLEAQLLLLQKQLAAL